MPQLVGYGNKDGGDNKFAKDTYVGGKGKKKPAKRKKKKMSKAEFLKMVREKKYKKK